MEEQEIDLFTRFAMIHGVTEPEEVLEKWNTVKMGYGSDGCNVLSTLSHFLKKDCDLNVLSWLDNSVYNNLIGVLRREIEKTGGADSNHDDLVYAFREYISHAYRSVSPEAKCRFFHHVKDVVHNISDIVIPIYQNRSSDNEPLEGVVLLIEVVEDPKDVMVYTDDREGVTYIGVSEYMFAQFIEYGFPM